MHISKIDEKYPVAFKPNNMVLRTKSENSALELQLLMTLFILPASLFPENREITIDTKLITDKPLKGSICSRIRNAIDNITDAKFEIYQDKTHYEFINVFEKAGRNGDIITATVTKPAIEAIKKCIPKGFTKIPLEDTIKLTTAYQIGLLTIFLSFDDNKNSRPSFDLDYIRTQLGISNKYSQWDHLNKRVLDPSLKKINEKLGYDIDFKGEKKGKKTTAITMGEKTNRKKSKDNFEFALSCLTLLPDDVKERYFKEIPGCVGEQIALYSAVDNLIRDHGKLLKKCKSPYEFVKAFTC